MKENYIDYYILIYIKSYIAEYLGITLDVNENYRQRGLRNKRNLQIGIGKFPTDTQFSSGPVLSGILLQRSYNISQRKFQDFSGPNSQKSRTCKVNLSEQNLTTHNLYELKSTVR